MSQRQPFEVIVASVPGFPEALSFAPSKGSGIQRIISLAHCDDVTCSNVISKLAESADTYGVAIECERLAQVLTESRAPAGLDRIILPFFGGGDLLLSIESIHAANVAAWVQVTCLEDAATADRCGADAIVVKGSESGGRVAEETTFILLQRIIPRVKAPVFALGGIGLHTAGACLAAGARGVVLDWQLALCADIKLPNEVQERVARMDGSETAILGQNLGVQFRVFARPGETAIPALKDVESTIAANDAAGPSLIRRWINEIDSRVASPNTRDRLLLIGQDACFAAKLAQEFGDVAGVCRAVRDAAVNHLRAAARLQPLAPNGPLATSHGTLFPIVQGPMTRVSDTSDFALAVAEGGGLPFLALALLRGPRVGVLLEETKKQLGDRPWGIGILGFVPRELRVEQLEEVRKHRPPYAIIAGGRPDQAAALERDGIQTYLHVPSPALLGMYLESGARRVIFEGRECGGHVGPRTSFVLWESMVDVLLDHLGAAGNRGEEYHVLFAGGVHDALSAAMVSTLAAPLAKRGVRIGVLLGTAYLFTREAVTTGAIVEGFQREALACRRTILLETGVGHATRCADTPYGRDFAQEKRRLIRERRAKDEIRDSLERLNLGRLRIASKGLVRTTEAEASRYAKVDEASQHREGMYMIGQVAALRDRTCTIKELHEDVSAAGSQRLVEAVPRGTALNQRNCPSDIAIVGMSCLFPKAGDLNQFWENILDKVNAITEIPIRRWNRDLYYHPDRSARDKIYSKWGGFLEAIPFDPARYGMPPNTLSSLEPLQLLVLETVRKALEDAGYADCQERGVRARPFNRERTSVILGAGGGVGDRGLGYGFRSLLPYFVTQGGGTPEEAQALIERLDGQLPEWSEDSFAGLLMNVAAGRVANRFDLGGSNYTVDAACASSLAAVRLAVDELESGSSDMVIVGGADTMQSPFAYLCFSKTQALSPTGQCKTFDESADGIVISEGVAVAVLKRLDDALDDGDRIYAVIKGVGSSSDGRDKGLTAPRPAGQVRALERAYDKAGIDPATVALIEAHGTGTVAGDQSEVTSLNMLFHRAGAGHQRCALGSVKSMIGHTKCTAGIAGLIKAALALHHKTLPPTIGVTRPNRKAGFGGGSFYVNSEARPWMSTLSQPRRAGVSAFGFGGTNFHAVLEEFVGETGSQSMTPGRKVWPAELLVWRAETPRAILDSMESILEALRRGAQPSLCDLAAAVCQHHGENNGDCALAVVAVSLEDLRAKLEQVRSHLGRPAGAAAAIQSPQGVFYAPWPLTREGKVAFVFPGQGSQRVNMLADLAIGLPVVRKTLEEADRCLGNAWGQPFSRFVFPVPKFTSEDQAQDDRRLMQTDIAQPAMGAADLAMLRLLESLGIRPDMVCGHSYGEYVALYAAGVYGASDLFRISEARGRLMAEAATSCPGAMAAVDAGEAVVREALASISELSIANINGPRQTVVSGTQQAIEFALETCKKRSLAARRIRVSCAFHSPLMAPVQSPFKVVLDGVSFASPRLPVYSNTTAAPHASNGGQLRATLVEHLVRPVRFADEISAMYQAGARVFIEVGPGRVLTALMESQLQTESVDSPVVAIHLDQPGRNGLVQWLHGLARIAAVGVRPDLRRLFEGRVRQQIDLSRLVGQTGPKPLPPLTWMVDGAQAMPMNGSAPKAPRTSNPPKPRLLTNVRDTVGPPTASLPSMERVGVANAGRNQVSEPGATASKGSEPGAPATGAVVFGGNSPTADPNRPTPDREPVSARSDGSQSSSVPSQCSSDVEKVMGAYHAMMQQFLESQKKIMLSYLGRAAVSPTALDAPTDPAVNERRELPPSRPPLWRGDAVSASGVSDALRGESLQQASSDQDGIAADDDGTGKQTASDGGGNNEHGKSDRARGNGAILTQLLEVVSDRTGYPPDMLDLDLDLEADLGIDSIKRVEILGTLQSRSMISTQSDDGGMEALSKLKTLRSIVEWIEAKETGSPASSAALDVESSGIANTPESSPSTSVKGEHGIDSIPRMGLRAVERELLEGSSTTKPEGAVLIVDDEQGVAGAVGQALHERGIPFAIVSSTRTPSSNGIRRRWELDDPGRVKELVRELREQHDSIGALIYLLPLSAPAGIECEQLSSGYAPMLYDLQALLLLLQQLEGDLRRSGSGRILVATRLNGLMGTRLHHAGADFCPFSGAVLGMGKSLAREWDNVATTVIDFDPALDVATTASFLVAELLNPDGQVEVGYHLGRRHVLQPVPAEVGRASAGVGLDDQSVVLITGGARGITAEIAVELAHQFRPRLILVGRSPLPVEPESEETRGVTDARELKAILRRRMERLRGPSATISVREVEDQYHRLMRDREIQANLTAMRTAGATVEYHSLDVTDSIAFGAMMDEIYRRYGRIDGVIHGAGVAEDRLLRDKTQESLRRVVEPKVRGALTLIEKLRPDSLRFLFFFSSVSARFGNRGQADYAAANEVLNKLAQWLSARWPARVVSLNWGPWESLGGMVSPELARQFARAGIVMISRAAGRRALIDEIWHGAKEDVEVLFGGPLQLPASADDAARELDTDRFPLLSQRAQISRNHDGSMEVRRNLDPQFDLYLLDHQLDGRPVMPMAMGLELLAEVAASCDASLALGEIRDLRVLRGIQVGDGACAVRVRAVPQPRDERGVQVALQLVEGADSRICYTATAELRPRLPFLPLPEPLKIPDAGPLGVTIDEAYDRWLFHGPLFAGIVGVEAIGREGIIGRLSSSSPRRCLADSLSEAPASWLIDPVIIDSGLQLLILWTRTFLDMTGLPSRMGRYHRYQTAPSGDVRCEVRVRNCPGSPMVNADLLFLDQKGEPVGLLEDMEAACSRALNRLSENAPVGRRAVP